MTKFLTTRMLICGFMVGILIAMLTLAAVKQTPCMAGAIACKSDTGGKLLWDEFPRRIVNFISL